MIDNLAVEADGFTSNVFLVTGERTVLVDAGNGFDVVEQIRERTEELDAVVLTHTHPDHVGNLEAVTDAFGVDVWGFDPDAPGVDHELAEEATITLGDDDYTVLHTPGHKDDHVCLYAPEPGILFAGDLIFENGGFGRTDLEEGDRQLLLESIDRLLQITDEDLSALHAGHGKSVTVDPYQTIELAHQAARMR
ncbi:MBL fold metallo-hydrolase [Halorhabdus rudnickae]|uniref:MBL fold metallo-hydrolase n=1 Tax=Halorhabdus rudnickae TaxID=1775544 RepID=UPI001082871A|nr:MBL fold metallo-hydrolase [Halorhabdus rudnickae]